MVESFLSDISWRSYHNHNFWLIPEHGVTDFPIGGILGLIGNVGST